MKEELCQAFCNELTVRDVPMGLAVSTAFSFPDGDRIGFYVKEVDDGFEIQDNGMVFPALEANGLDRKNKSRADALTALMEEYDVILDEDDKEFFLSARTRVELPAAALRFVSFLLRVGDLLLLAEERVASTFRLDVERILRERLGEGVLIQAGQAISANLADFPPDYLIQAEGRDPVALFLGTSDARVLEALFVQLRAEHEERIPVKIVTLLEREKSISAAVRQQATNRLDALLQFRGDEAAAIGRVIKEVGLGHAIN
ncbi:hypothetical protein J2W40_001737 [Sphingobium xenophagum]|uniref:DUF1828 domain-containing protein n=1 Tax=Sphingobium xenophagum TaxID=121428 RepID=A0ABU1X0E6_SPHXE|nr:DUF1828 domain-containing protein [Sphingobium xenophagum]MDR7154919.1 hypothetical protein [Sphingobium xenophagum]